MARTIAEIRDQINTEAQTYPSLVSFASASQTSIYWLIIYVISYAIWFHESLWDNRYLELDAKVRSMIAGTALWYQQQALLFQYGDSLTYDSISGQYVYDPIDVSARIVKLASVRESAGFLVIKVAKLSAGAPVALSAPEVAAFQSYINTVKFAGTFISVVSESGDDLLIDSATIYYDPIIPVATVKNAVVAAVNDYIKSLPFDGRLSVDALESSIRAVTGVKEVVLTSVKARLGAGAYTTVSGTYITGSGYLVLDAASAITSTSNYTPYV